MSSPTIKSDPNDIFINIYNIITISECSYCCMSNKVAHFCIGRMAVIVWRKKEILHCGSFLFCVITWLGLRRNQSSLNAMNEVFRMEIAYTKRPISNLFDTLLVLAFKVVCLCYKFSPRSHHSSISDIDNGS